MFCKTFKDWELSTVFLQRGKAEAVDEYKGGSLILFKR